MDKNKNNNIPTQNRFSAFQEKESSSIHNDHIHHEHTDTDHKK